MRTIITTISILLIIPILARVPEKSNHVLYYINLGNAEGTFSSEKRDDIRLFEKPDLKSKPTHTFNIYQMYMNKDSPFKFIKKFYDESIGNYTDYQNRIVSYQKKGSFYKVRYENKTYWIYKDDPLRIEHVLGECNSVISGKIKGYKNILQSNESEEYQSYDFASLLKSTILYKKPNVKSTIVIDAKKLKTKEKDYYTFIKRHRWIKNQLWLNVRIYPELLDKPDPSSSEVEGKKFYDAWIYPFDKKGRQNVTCTITY